ncbi:MAG: pyridoxal-phosphate dependent enzyme, partial [Longicatena sp.]
MKQTVTLIGNTPLYHIENTNIYVKLEKFNAGGSVKDRAVLWMLTKAMENGSIEPNSVLVEATSGNTGIGLSLVAAARGYKLILTMPDTMTVERRNL